MLAKVYVPCTSSCSKEGSAIRLICYLLKVLVPGYMDFGIPR